MMNQTSTTAQIVQPGGPVELREVALPEIEPGGVLLKTLYSEVCGTDCHLLHGKLEGVPYPLIPGHVSVGEIATINGTVRDVDGVPFEIGDRVAFLDVHETCGACWYCTVGKASTRCPSRRVYGITYGADDGLLGGWSQFIYLKPGVRLLRLPEKVSPLSYIAGGCGMPTAFHAIERAQIQLGDTVVIQGSGPVGLNALIFAQVAGAAQVIMTGSPQLRLDLARQYGADEVIDIATTTPAERIARIREQTGGRGADVTIEACGNPAAVVEGMEMTRDAGRYVVVGQYTDNGPVEVNPHLHINRKHLDVRGCWGCDFSHIYRGLSLMARWSDHFDWQAMITRKYKLSEAAEALEDVAQLRVIKAVIEP
ncbi:MAG: 2-desacetyl-2-hydroxyethyl bacteriochlorophyllide A dehydrogenase [Verrucomicrobiales bacterium]|jgi:2-desacetyl-2-hydroxyethyl bacteriochlorophyllide A dehydrogenase